MTLGSARRAFVPLAAFAISVGLGVVAALGLRAAMVENHDLQHDEAVRDSVAALQARVDAYLALLAGAAGVLAAEQDESLTDFEAFATHLDLRAQHPGIVAMAFLLRVRPDERQAFGETIRQLWRQDRAIRPAPAEGAEAWPIVAVHPYDAITEGALGFDALADPIRRAALERARDLRVATATAPLSLIDGNPVPGLVLYRAVYERAAPRTLEQRQATLSGFAALALNTDQLLDTVFHEEVRAWGMDVYDGLEMDPAARLYRRGGGALGAARAGTVTVADRAWTVVVAPPPAHPAAWAPWVFLVCGAGAGLGFALVLHRQTLAREAAEHAAACARASEAALKESERRFHRLVESDVVGFGIVDGAGLVREANDALLGLTGRRREDLERGAVTFGAVTAPEFHEVDARAMAEVRRAGAHPPYEKEILRPDGSRVPVLAGAVHLGGPDDLVLRVLVDLTALKAAQRALCASEERLRTMMEQSSLAIHVLDRDGRTLNVNHAWELLWGVARGEALRYRPLDDRQLQQNGAAAFIGRAFDGQATFMPPLLYVPRRGARQRQEIWVRSHAYPVKGEDGGVREVVVLQEDVTEQRRAEQTLLHAQRAESLGVLAGGIAHDFNNLMTGIIGNAGLALHFLPRDARLRAMLQDIVRAGERAAHLTKQMLAYAGKGNIYPTRLDLTRLLAESHDLLRAAIPANVRIQVDLPRGPVPVEADAGQVRQLLLNLALNAAEAVGERPGAVWISLAAVELEADRIVSLAGWEVSPGRHARLEVADDGCGIPAEVLPRIFDPFFSTKFVGRGLGLAAAHGIVRGHHGGIEVRTRPGEGSSFVVYLPLLPELETPVAAEPPPRWRGKVLVVDDEELVLGTALAALDAHGIPAEGARDGAEALSLLRKDPAGIGIVLLDLTMPRMGGPEALAGLRAVRADLRVIAWSGYAEEEARRRLGGHAIDGFLQKPFTVKALVDTVTGVGGEG